MDIGLIPAAPLRLVALLVPILGWLFTRRKARENHQLVMHNASLAVSYWEELLFRGIAYGAVFALSHNGLIAIVVSSIMFGLFHLRNLWWSTPKHLAFQVLYTSLFFGPIAATLRWWSGDVYFAIAFHAVNNFMVIASPRSQAQPTDELLLSKVRQMKWWQRGLIGFWSSRSSSK